MMKRFFRTLAAATAMAGWVSPALADISAQEVRDVLVDYYESFGMAVDIGAEQNADGVITLENMALSVAVPDQNGAVTIEFQKIGFRETGDGAVAIELPASMKTRISFEGEDGPPFSAMLLTSLQGFSAIVSGSRRNMHIETSADGTASVVNAVKVGDQEFPVKFVVQTGPLKSEYSLSWSLEERLGITGSYEAANIELLANVKEPGGGSGFFTLKTTLESVAARYSGDLANVADPMAMLAAGLEVSGEIELGALGINSAFQDRRNSFTGKVSIDGQRFAATLSPDVFIYEINQNGSSVSVTSSEMPIPSLDFAYDEFDVALEVPLSHSAEPRDYHVRAALRGVSVTEMIWAMFDPGQTLSREPATVAIDVGGKVMVLTDLMNSETLAKIDKMDVPPMLPVSVVINEITAAFGGALLSGDGSFTFNFQNPAMVNGVPLPVGKATVKLDGGYGLLDKLAAIGLVPQDTVMGLRAMLGTFAKPVGDDQFESVLEVTEEGAISANGQRLK